MTFEVKLTYSAFKIYEIEAESQEIAHKKAYNSFMDSSSNDVFEESVIDVEDFSVETSVLGDNGTDMMHP